MDRMSIYFVYTFLSLKDTVSLSASCKKTRSVYLENCLKLYFLFLKRRWQREEHIPRELKTYVEDGLGSSNLTNDIGRNRLCISFVMKKMEEPSRCRTEGCEFWGILEQDHNCTYHFYTKREIVYKLVSDEKLEGMICATKALRIGKNEWNDHITSEFSGLLKSTLDNDDGNHLFLTLHHAHTIIDRLIPKGMKYSLNRRQSPNLTSFVIMLMRYVMTRGHTNGSFGIESERTCCGFDWDCILSESGCHILGGSLYDSRMSESYKVLYNKRKIEDSNLPNKRQKWI
jgi:hypothetical protein